MTKKKESMAVELMDLTNVSQAIVIMGNGTLTDTRTGGTTFEDDNPKFVARIAETDESGSEYKGPASDDSQPETETDDEPVCEEGRKLEDEEPDTNIKLKQSKKKKKGVIAREQISVAVAAIDDKPSPRIEHHAPEKATVSKT